MTQSASGLVGVDDDSGRDFLGRCAGVESTDDGVERHPSAGDTYDALYVGVNR